MSTLQTPSVPPEPQALSLRKWHVVAPLLILQVWPLTVVLEAQRLSPMYYRIFHDMLKGAALPEVTEFVFHTYAWWWMAPLVTTILTLLTLSGRVKTMAWPAFCLTLTVLSAVMLRHLFFMGIIAPITEIITRLAGGP